MTAQLQSMRDVIIDDIYRQMSGNENIFFLSCDFGSPRLDFIRKDFPGRFINVGIAEQNAVNISLGLALEGFSVIVYGIAPFITMRAFEQLRVNLSIHSQLRNVDVTIIGVGAGLSYDVSGPTHHCLEDISIINSLPFFSVYSPSDPDTALKLFKASRQINGPKYFRLDGKPLADVPAKVYSKDVLNGFRVISEGKDTCIIATGYMTQTASRIIEKNRKFKIGLIDIMRISPLSAESLISHIRKYKKIFTIEEGFIGCGGLDSVINRICNELPSKIFIRNMGFGKKFIFDMGTRDEIHKLYKLDCDSIAAEILKQI